MSTSVTELEASAPAALEVRFGRFVQEHRERAVRMAWRLTGEDRATAEEIAQDAFLRAHRALGRFREDAALSTWFYRILVRQAANHRRWRGLRQHWAGIGSREPPPQSRGGRSDPNLRDRIADAMEQLTPPQRDLFVLVHLEGFTVREAAHLTGRAPGTVKSHLHRALRTLRAELATEWEDYRS